MLMEPYGDLTEEEAFEMFDEQISAGVTEKPDLITLETFSDADMLRIAAEAAAKVSLKLPKDIPHLFISAVAGKGLEELKNLLLKTLDKGV